MSRRPFVVTDLFESLRAVFGWRDGRTSARPRRNTVRLGVENLEERINPFFFDHHRTITLDAFKGLLNDAGVASSTTADFIGTVSEYVDSIVGPAGYGLNGDSAEHFDRSNFTGTVAHINAMYQQAVDRFNSDDIGGHVYASAPADTTTEWFGIILHSVQDFYSHS